MDFAEFHEDGRWNAILIKPVTAVSRVHGLIGQEWKMLFKFIVNKVIIFLDEREEA
jgi:hypothetical protein